MEMMQLWVNLPSHLKMTKPRYQPILAQAIPTVALDDDAGTVQIIAGRFRSTMGAAQTDFFDDKQQSLKRGHIDLWKFSLKPGMTTEFQSPTGNTALVFAQSGALLMSQQAVPERAVVVMQRQGTHISVTCPKEAKQNAVFVFLGGEPIVDKDGQPEPIAARGPMVMNTQEELRDAMAWSYSVMDSIK